MRRVITCFIISVGCLVSSGCQPTILQHSYTHPHSAVTAPTFCLYWGEDEYSQPIRVYEITVVRYEAFSDDKRFEWRDWESWREGRSADLVIWQIQYLPDDEAHPLAKPLSCITYGKSVQIQRGTPLNWKLSTLIDGRGDIHIITQDYTNSALLKREDYRVYRMGDIKMATRSNVFCSTIC